MKTPLLRTNFIHKEVPEVVGETKFKSAENLQQFFFSLGLGNHTNVCAVLGIHSKFYSVL